MTNIKSKGMNQNVPIDALERIKVMCVDSDGGFVSTTSHGASITEMNLPIQTRNNEVFVICYMKIYGRCAYGGDGIHSNVGVGSRSAHSELSTDDANGGGTVSSFACDNMPSTDIIQIMRRCTESGKKDERVTEITEPIPYPYDKLYITCSTHQASDVEEKPIVEVQGYVQEVTAQELATLLRTFRYGD